jgi:catechol 2,3-dioxygenase-like lactoylglutathione lyase family enzyme
VLQHVSLEIPPDEVEDASRFWELLGFAKVDSPEALGGYVTWLERAGTHIHLIHTDGAAAPVLGHAAVVVDDFEAAMARVAEAGHEVEETRQLWGARRAFAVGPGGHRVELMEFPPPPTPGLG